MDNHGYDADYVLRGMVADYECCPMLYEPDPSKVSERSLEFSTGMTYMYDKEEIAMLSIRLPEEIESRLERLARRTGRTKSYYARAAILEKIEDMEDAYLAEQVLERIRKGDEKTVSSEEMWRELDN